MILLLSLQTTYFVAYRNVKTKKMCAKGKLVYKFYNSRRKYLLCGAIPSKNQQRKSEVEDDVQFDSKQSFHFL